jgi:PAS domain S-box-containing protein
MPSPDSEPHARRDSGAAYRALVENAVHGILRADRDGTFIAVNPALAEMLGYDSDDELAGATALPDLTAPAEYERPL